MTAASPGVTATPFSGTNRSLNSARLASGFATVAASRNGCSGTAAPAVKVNGGSRSSERAALTRRMTIGSAVIPVSTAPSESVSGVALPIISMRSAPAASVETAMIPPARFASFQTASSRSPPFSKTKPSHPSGSSSSPMYFAPRKYRASI